MGRHKRRMLLATTGVLLLPIGLGGLPAAQACSCVPNDTIEAQTSRADVIFDGIPTERTATQPPSFDPVTWRFDVSTVVKGTATDPQDVITADNGAMCGAHFDLGRRYRVFARREGDRLSTSNCAGNRLLGDDGSVPGYRLAAADGGVFTFGDAPFHGRPFYMGQGPAVDPATGITASHSGNGYWITDRSGGTGGFGDTAPLAPNQPPTPNGNVAIARTSSSPGLVVTTPAGRVTTYNASSFGDLGGQRLDAPVVGASA